MSDVQKNGRFQNEGLVRKLQENVWQKARNKTKHAVDFRGHEGTERRRYKQAVALSALPARMMWLGGLD